MSQRDRVDPRVARSRTVIIRATLELLAWHGIRGTTIEAVAAHSGVARTTIYRHWDNLPALFTDVFDQVLQPPPDPDTGTLREDLRLLLTGLTNALTTGPGAPLMTTLLDAAAHDPAYAAIHTRLAAARHQVILTVIERGLQRGELPTGTDPADVLDMLAGPLFHRRLMTNRRVDTDFAHRMVDLTLDALRSPTT